MSKTTVSKLDENAQRSVMGGVAGTTVPVMGLTVINPNTSIWNCGTTYTSCNLYACNTTYIRQTL